MQVAEGIVKVDGTRVGGAYVALTDDGAVVIDTGMPGNAARIVAAIERAGRRPAQIRAIILTHWHPDHMGSAAALRRATGAPVAIGALDAPVLAGRGLPAKGRRAMRLIQGLLRIKPLDADVILAAGDEIEGLEVIDVPGHTAGSIALRRADGVVFTGDSLLGDGRGNLRPPDPGLCLDPDRARDSARSILALEPRLLLPGHGAPVHDPTSHDPGLDSGR